MRREKLTFDKSGLQLPIFQFSATAKTFTVVVCKEL